MTITERARDVTAAVVAVATFAAVAPGQQTSRVSVDSTGIEGNDHSWTPAISGDGRFVAFMSNASNFFSGDAWYADVFVHDRSTGITEIDSISSSGNHGVGWSEDPAISADGRIVGFASDDPTLVSGDTNNSFDIFVHDRTTGSTERVSVDSAGHQANFKSHHPVLSSDGSIVAFESRATNLVAGDVNRCLDVFVHDRSSGITERVSVDSSGAESNGPSSVAAISPDGRFVVFQSVATNLVAGDTNGFADVFLRDRLNGTTERISVDASGAEGNGDALEPQSVSSDGRFVAFVSAATNLVAGDSNGVADVFLRDRSTGTVERVSVSSDGSEGDGACTALALTSDANVVSFASLSSNLVPGDGNNQADVFFAIARAARRRA